MLAQLKYAVGQSKRWAPSLAAYGAVTSMAIVYMTDKWIGRPVLARVPWIGDRYQLPKEEN
ncbi:hypothetical protein PTSG_09888 [Salpingoeca rosetta]|uniref:Uncharacterized protein n=1 Tax=Salpingoeca rosetta (strain ATCC 50818 / BSB-021) TaxID=946362 RepID=F2UNF2_SALR5|nr:uncharacterized protein PTSG_09888 [Salpingoeca rosetta]EGD79157.1 hypothetical protein PTSG_09888 [Salpingoeca rosetta]|eukprot:XP_004989242.1 hypothetical protein PTSG_09888 [Salpingoeca rosetta]